MGAGEKFAERNYVNEIILRTNEHAKTQIRNSEDAMKTGGEKHGHLERMLAPSSAIIVLPMLSYLAQYR